MQQYIFQADPKRISKQAFFLQMPHCIFIILWHQRLQDTQRFLQWQFIITFNYHPFCFLLVFSLGAVSLRMDTIGLLSSAESSTVSLQGVSLLAIKTLTENMESCCPASQTPNPVLKLTAIAFSYHITTHTLQVIISRSVLFLQTE